MSPVNFVLITSAYQWKFRYPEQILGSYAVTIGVYVPVLENGYRDAD